MEHKTVKLSDIRKDMARHVERMGKAKDNETRLRAMADAFDVLLSATEAHVRGNVADA